MSEEPWSQSGSGIYSSRAIYGICPVCYMPMFNPKTCQNCGLCISCSNP